MGYGAGPAKRKQPSLRELETLVSAHYSPISTSTAWSSFPLLKTDCRSQCETWACRTGYRVGIVTLHGVQPAADTFLNRIPPHPSKKHPWDIENFPFWLGQILKNVWPISVNALEVHGTRCESRYRWKSFMLQPADQTFFSLLVSFLTKAQRAYLVIYDSFTLDSSHLNSIVRTDEAWKSSTAPKMSM